MRTPIYSKHLAKSALRFERKLQVGDGFALLAPHLLIVGRAGEGWMVWLITNLVVDVMVRLMDLITQHFDQTMGVAVEEFAIAFQVNASAWLENLAIHLKELGRDHAMLGALIFDLRVGEGDPNGIDFTWTKAACDPLDAGSQKGRIGQWSFHSGFCATPHAGALDVHADEIGVRVQLG